ncbi:DUF4276 family protein [Agrobacterium vitis]|uniref:DUF4276 family protein n=1 Tax=Agrobacterium vitis TaxID=373 RepID=A0A368NYH9_AGRVI|nr:DUF4276 family protein [Agrobacterium vitis]KAA3519695.1 DUF4276 family protein [Agrobacterium vitis]KAA3532093.1 DUF4276 family protein [Agrobacterium vitis]MCF1475847.1 DUF4276 family protein [Agrobacterium vitis]MUZ97095.1 DUF4276 family protein [Agrobacterium vitis]MVA32015.1 DUF4276 family protein [Agrobacterium vitis]
MTRIKLLVEGQTEATFIDKILAPHYAHLNVYFLPIPVRTSISQKGGLTRYSKVKPQIEILCKQDANAWVTTMFDLYALPNDFPGMSDSHFKALRNGREKATYIEKQMSTDIGRRNFIPNITVHEFEALLFSDISAFRDEADMSTFDRLKKQIPHDTAPEDINGGSQTAPSKRILAGWPAYDKVRNGANIAERIGLATIRQKCPHFSTWLKRLEGLK